MPLGAFKAGLMGASGATTAADVVLLSDQDADSDTAIVITSGIDSTYTVYAFAFYNLNPETDNQHFTFNASIDGGSNYNVAKTTLAQSNYNAEADAGGWSYEGGLDIHGTGYTTLFPSVGSGADECASVYMYLFNPASTTYAKHYIAEFSGYRAENAVYDFYSGGYFNTTDNIDALRFLFASGDFEGTIKMWGMK